MPKPIMPFGSVNQTDVTAAYEEWRVKPASQIEARIEALDADMERAYAQAGPDLDVEKIDCVGGSTVVEKQEKLVGIHSELAGLHDALKERKDMEAASRAIRDGNRGGGDPDPRPRPRTFGLHVRCRSPTWCAAICAITASSWARRNSPLPPTGVAW